MMAKSLRVLSLCGLAFVATGFHNIAEKMTIRRTSSVRVLCPTISKRRPRRAPFLRSTPGPSEADQEERDAKAQLKQMDQDEFDSRRTELSSIRDRIKQMAEEKEGLEVDSGWVPQMTRASADSVDDNVGAAPEMTTAMGSLATFLGDERVVKDDELDYEDGAGEEDGLDVWLDPLEELQFTVQLFEEAKLVDWPGPGEVVKQLALTILAIIGVSLFIYGIDKFGIEYGKTIFTYGVNPDATGTLDIF
mmetsp:Transcript_80583/g.160795  ORF Transcript_80583/g.160795 Transcript_80583/m.160795 type:complete len:248 (+) Transcript_80583:3-746(+)